MRRLERRRTVILLLAVLLPSATLVGIAVRLLRQERELAQRRLVQARRTTLAELGQTLHARLNLLTSETPPDSVVVIAAPVSGGTFQLPWETTSQRAARDLDVLLGLGNTAELRARFAAADSLYARAQSLARDSASRALVTLYRARNAAARGHTAMARALYAQLVQLPLELRDEEGMPYSLYAADWLHAHAQSVDVRRAFTNPALKRPLSPIALYALRTYQRGEDSLRTEHQIAEAEQLLALKRDYRGLLSSNAQQGGDVWLAYGRQPWLVRADSSRIIAVRAQPLLASVGARLQSADRAGAEPLGWAFPGTYASSPGFTADDAPRTSRTLLFVIVALTVGLGVLSASIAWRDVRREVHAAALRTQFVSNVSHELKTPLTAIRMYAELLRMGGDLDGTRRYSYLDTIINESERLSRLINNVLDFSRIERGERTYQRAPVQLDQLATDIQRSLSYPLQQAGFELGVSVEPGLPAVNVDRDALAQAVLNLLSNALKFSDKARRIELDIVRRDHYAVIRVTDHGRGITAEARPHIFEKFYRSPDVAAAGIPGTGLGLALVEHVAHGHGGSVDVVSETGRGSTFSMYLPVGAP